MLVLTKKIANFSMYVSIVFKLSVIV